MKNLPFFRRLIVRFEIARVNRAVRKKMAKRFAEMDADRREQQAALDSLGEHFIAGRNY